MLEGLGEFDEGDPGQWAAAGRERSPRFERVGVPSEATERAGTLGRKTFE
jgi:hypothetical protein